MDFDQGKKEINAQIDNDIFSLPLLSLDANTSLLRVPLTCTEDNLDEVAAISAVIKNTKASSTVPSQIMKDLTTPLQYNHRFILDSFQNNRN